jgi:hypothetical protein
MKLKYFIALFVFLSTGNLLKGQIKSEYYKDSEIIFCEDVVNGNPVNPSSFFIISPDGGYVTIMVNNGKPIKTENLIVQVWKTSKSSDYDEFIETKKININYNTYTPYFKYIFYEAGKYKIVINNKDEELINIGYISIIVK